MLVYKHMMFCEAECGNTGCRRNWTPEHGRAATEWWGKPGAPVAFSDFSPKCPAYEKRVK